MNQTDTNIDAASLLDRFLRACIGRKASDLHLSAGLRPHFRIEGTLAPNADWPETDAATTQALGEHLARTARGVEVPAIGAIDGALSAHDGTRFRFNVYRCSRGYSIALRRLEDRIRTLSELGLPSELYSLSEFSHGLVLIAGPTGSGKSTTLATLLDKINQTRSTHIVTIEDPIEYIHHSNQSLVDQREVGSDTDSFYSALVASLRQDPDVILVGEIRDLNTIRTAITAAETGHLVFSTIHAGDCVGSIDRLVSVFPADEQTGVRRQLAMVLRAVVAQRLIVGDGPKHRRAAAEGELSRLVLGSEAMFVTSPVANLISNAKDTHIYSIMETGRSDGMYTLDENLAGLLRDGEISERTASGLARNPQVMLTRSKKFR